MPVTTRYSEPITSHADPKVERPISQCRQNAGSRKSGLKRVRAVLAGGLTGCMLIFPFSAKAYDSQTSRTQGPRVDERYPSLPRPHIIPEASPSRIKVSVNGHPVIWFNQMPCRDCGGGRYPRTAVSFPNPYGLSGAVKRRGFWADARSIACVRTSYLGKNDDRSVEIWLQRNYYSSGEEIWRVHGVTVNRTCSTENYWRFRGQLLG